MFQPAIPNCGYFIVLTLDDGSSPLNGGIRSFSCLRDTPQIAPEKGLGVDEMAICLLGRNGPEMWFVLSIFSGNHRGKREK